LINSTHFETSDYTQQNKRMWGAYTCSRCGGVVTAWAHKGTNEVIEMFPRPLEVDEAIPSRAKEYLSQAINSLSSPAGAVMLAACAVDAMLKEKGFKDGSLYSRINKAADDHLITKDMSHWAHEVRLDANDQRHVDEAASLPTTDDARRVIDFTQALGMFLFVLPARVQRGLKNATPAN
jgi:hypothetical protein